MLGMELRYFMLSVVPKENIIWLFFIQIENATSDTELKTVIEASSDILIDNSITTAPSLVEFKDKVSIVKALSLQLIIIKSKGELDQLKNGLRTLGVADAMERSPVLLHSVFTTIGHVELTPGKLMHKLKLKLMHYISISKMSSGHCVH